MFPHESLEFKNPSLIEKLKDKGYTGVNIHIFMTERLLTLDVLLFSPKVFKKNYEEALIETDFLIHK